MAIRGDSRENGTCQGARSRIGAFAAAAALVVAAAGTGCGGDDEARSEERPPVPINISIVVNEKNITASPAEFGAGPITLLISNQSGGAQTLTIDGPRLRRSMGPINPDDTATVRLRVEPGEYTVSAAESSGLPEESLQVGPARPSAQNELLLP